MKKLFLIISLFTFTYVQAQLPINMGNDSNDFFLRTFEAQERVADEGENPNIKGSRYFNDEFVKGKVYASKVSSGDVEMRYDMFYDAFQFRFKGSTRRLDPRLAIERIEMGDDTFVIRAFEYKGKPMSGFLQQLVDGKYKLFAKKNMSLRPEQPPRALETEPKPAEYLKKKDTYYIEQPDGKLVEVATGKDLAKVLGNGKLESEAKKKKISLKNDKGLVELVELMNEMDL